MVNSLQKEMSLNSGLVYCDFKCFVNVSITNTIRRNPITGNPELVHDFACIMLHEKTQEMTVYFIGIV